VAVVVLVGFVLELPLLLLLALLTRLLWGLEVQEQQARQGV
jgi:hypothetical protein